MISPCFRREPIGYRYWCMQRTRYGWRQIGPEALLVMDDFGTLVFSTAAPLLNTEPQELAQ